MLYIRFTLHNIIDILEKIAQRAFQMKSTDTNEAGWTMYGTDSNDSGSLTISSNKISKIYFMVVESCLTITFTLDYV